MDAERESIIAATRFATQEFLEYLSRNKISAVEYDCCEQNSSVLFQIVARLLCIIENGVCHGLKSFESISVCSHGPWNILQIINSDQQHQSKHIREIESVKTGLGRARLWIRQSLMSKKLGTDLFSLIENKDRACIPTKLVPFDVSAHSEFCSFADFYSKDSLLMSSSGIVFASLLSGLDIIDFCFILNDNLSLLDGPLIPIDYKSRINRQPNIKLLEISPSRDNLEKRLSRVIERKHYLEDSIPTDHGENDALQTSKADLESQILKLKEENARLSNLFVRQAKDVRNEVETLREQFRLSSLSLDSRNAELTRQIGEERKKRIAVEDALAQEKKSTSLLEAEIARLRLFNCQREASISEYRSQISALIALNKEFSGKLRSVTSDLEVANRRAGDLQDKFDGVSSVLEAANERCRNLKEGEAAKEKALKEAIKRAHQVDRQCVQLKADLEANKEITQSLQSQLDELYSESVSIKALQETLDRKSQTLEERETMISDLQRQCNEAEQTLMEMSNVVEAAQLRAEHAEECVRNLSTATWISDSDVTACSLCGIPFSFSRRKHHCRNCGMIYCQECSSFTMPLASSAKPVRVCESCHNQLMQRYAMR